MSSGDGNTKAELVRELQELRRRPARLESAADSSENERLWTLIENMPVMLDAFDADGNIVLWNQECERVTGYSRAEIVGNPKAMELLYPDPEYRGRMMLEWGERGNDYRAWEWELTARDGTVKTVCWSDISGRVPIRGFHTWGIGTDVSDFRAAEAALRKSEEQLAQAQRIEAIGRLAGGVAHDFNNLLTVILNSCDMLAGSLGDGNPMRDDVDVIRSASERAADLTRQLLAFSRKQIIRPEILDLNVVVSGTGMMLRRILGEDIDLLVVLDPELPHVHFDPGQAEQILFHLAVNARDAMPDGGTLTVETTTTTLDAAYHDGHPYTQPGRYVMLAVSDTGCGMNDVTRTKAYEPFFTTKEVGRGTGLGLSMVYGIVKQHGGSIEVYSEPGRGTAFKIYLPVVGGGLKVGEASAEDAIPTGDETVLLIEDEAAVRLIARRILDKLGYRVLEASNGREALALVGSHDGSIDLVLSDVVMPEMSGKEVVERLAKIRPGLKAVFMSGYTENAIVHGGVLEKGTRFIQKPFSLRTLATAVRSALAEEKTG